MSLYSLNDPELDQTLQKIIYLSQQAQRNALTWAIFLISCSNSSDAVFPLMCGLPDLVNASICPLVGDNENDSLCRVGSTAGLRWGMWAYSTFEVVQLAMVTYK